MRAFVKYGVLLLLATYALSACMSNRGSNENTVRGAATGAGAGAIAGILLGDSTEDVLRGAVAGAVVGGAIGYSLDRQEEELRRALKNDDVVIRNTGSELIVTLPESITFETDSTYVRQDLHRDLGALADNLQRYPQSDVEVVGHTDDVGSSEYNQDLSVRRALSVSDVLIENGVPSGRIIASGRGESMPAASNFTEAGRALNRRVEIVIRPEPGAVQS